MIGVGRRGKAFDTFVACVALLMLFAFLDSRPWLFLGYSELWHYMP